MHRLTINNLGPVSECEMTCRPFIVLTGEQASGKSTIAKVLYYFRTVKDDFLDAVMSVLLDVQRQEKSLIKALREALRKKFLRTFGYMVNELRPGMKIRYCYTKDFTITVRLIISRTRDRKILNVELNKPLADAVNEYEKYIFSEAVSFTKKPLPIFQAEISKIFNDNFDAVYMPSGRSMLAVLSNYVRPLSFDYCTQKYIENITAIRQELTGGIEGLTDYYKKDINIPQIWEQAQRLIDRVICGSYRVDGGEERIILKDGNSVRISFASSGQQDALWITNLLYYYLVQGQRRAMFIIEEPESHLFPSSQKYIMELISLLCNSGHSVLVTTHSPYVLGALNNLLYAWQFRKTDKQERAAKIIPQTLWLDSEKFSAYFVRGGRAEDCIDAETKQIQNERIDEISEVITDDYEGLLSLKYEDSENASE